MLHGRTFGDVTFSSSLVELALAVRTLDVVGGVQRWGRREVGEFSSSGYVRLGLLGRSNVRDKLLVFFSPVGFGKRLQNHSSRLNSNQGYFLLKRLNLKCQKSYVVCLRHINRLQRLSIRTYFIFYLI